MMLTVLLKSISPRSHGECSSSQKEFADYRMDSILL